MDVLKIEKNTYVHQSKEHTIEYPSTTVGANILPVNLAGLQSESLRKYRFQNLHVGTSVENRLRTHRHLLRVEHVFDSALFIMSKRIQANLM
jgi:hypothetical protein